MNKPKKQHWVSRFYLEQFATPETRSAYNPKVWAFSKFSAEPFPVGVRDFAAKNYLYTPKQEDGQRDWTLEDDFASLEGLISQRWQHLGQDFLDLENEKMLRKILALFIASLHMRHPRQKHILGDIHSELVQFLDSVRKDDAGNPALGKIIHGNLERELDNTTLDDLKQQTPEEVFLSSIKRISMELAHILLSKRWSIGFCEEPRLITSDNPVALLNADRESFGFNTKGSVVIFPISPTRVLTIDDKHDEQDFQYYPFDADAATVTNYLTWNNCEEFMVSHRHTDEVCAELVSYVQIHEEQLRGPSKQTDDSHT